MLIEKIEKFLRAPYEIPTTQPKNGVILASFPKSGNTWFRFVASNLLSINLKSEKSTFHTISNYAPEIRGNRKLKNLVESELLPTFLKSHFYYVKGFDSYKSVLIYRNPEKCLHSYYNYMKSEHSKQYKDFSSFLRSPRVGIDCWKLFHESWLKSNAIIISYEDLMKNQAVGIRLILNELGFDINDDIIQEAINYSSRDSMKEIENNLGDPNKKNRNFNFVGKSENRHQLSQKDANEMNYIKSECAVLYGMLEKRKIQFL